MNIQPSQPLKSWFASQPASELNAFYRAETSEIVFRDELTRGRPGREDVVRWDLIQDLMTRALPPTPQEEARAEKLATLVEAAAQGNQTAQAGLHNLCDEWNIAR